MTKRLQCIEFIDVLPSTDLINILDSHNVDCTYLN